MNSRFAQLFCIFSASIETMKSKKLHLLLLAFSFMCSIHAQENRQLKQVLAELKRFNEKEFPADTIVSAYPLGRYREEDILRRGAFYKAVYERLEAIAAAQLSAAD